MFTCSLRGLQYLGVCYNRTGLLLPYFLSYKEHQEVSSMNVQFKSDNLLTFYNESSENNVVENEFYKYKKIFYSIQMFDSNFLIILYKTDSEQEGLQLIRFQRLVPLRSCTML